MDICFTAITMYDIVIIQYIKKETCQFHFFYIESIPYDVHDSKSWRSYILRFFPNTYSWKTENCLKFFDAATFYNLKAYYILFRHHNRWKIITNSTDSRTTATPYFSHTLLNEWNVCSYTQKYEG